MGHDAARNVGRRAPHRRGPRRRRHCGAGEPAGPCQADLPKDRDAIEHALNRLAYGARPGDVERVQEIGLADLDRSTAPSGRHRRQRAEGATSGAAGAAGAIHRPEGDAAVGPPVGAGAERREGRSAPSTASGSSKSSSSTSGSTTSTSSPARDARPIGSPTTSATRSGRTSSGSSATCSKRPPRARRCSSISITG